MAARPHRLNLLRRHPLAAHGAALCLHDLLPGQPWERTADWTYVRFHGIDPVAHPYRGRYTGRRLRPVADRISTWLADGCDVYAYFNNDYEGNAVHDARWLRHALAEAGEAPALARR